MNPLAWQWTPYLIPFFLGGIISTGLGVVTWKSDRGYPNKIAALLLFSIASWTLGYACELANTTLPAKKFWDVAQFIGTTPLPVLWLAFALQFSGYQDWLDRRTLFLLSIIPGLTLILALTSAHHNLIWTHYGLREFGSLLVSDKSIGVGVWIFIAYTYLLVMVANIILVRSLLRSVPFFRLQVFALILGTMIPWVANLLDYLVTLPYPQDHLTTLALTLTSVTVFMNLDRLRRGDILPAVRARILEGMSDNVLILDGQGHIVEVNPATSQLLDLSPKAVTGQPLSEVWPELSSQLGAKDIGGTSIREVTVGEGDWMRVFDVRVSSLMDSRNRPVCQLIVLREITFRKAAEGSLSRYAAELETAKADIEQRALELSTILEGAKAAASMLDLDEALRLFADRILRVTGGDGCTLSRWDRESDTVVTWIELRRDGKSADPPGKVYPLELYPATRKVMESGQPLVVQRNDPDADPAEVALLQDHGISRMLMLPLTVTDRVTGLVEVDSSHPEGAFTKSQIGLCRGIADLAASTIERARLFRELDKRAFELTSILDAVAVSSSSLDLEEVLSNMARQMVYVIGVKGCTISRWDREKDCVEIWIKWGITPDDNHDKPGTRYALEDHPLTRSVLETRSPRVVYGEDPDADPAEVALMRDDEGLNVLMLPLIHRDRVIGLVELTAGEEEHVFTDPEIRLAHGLADQAAIAIENARLHSETQRRLKEQIALRESAELLSGTLELDETLSHIAERIAIALDATSTYICIEDATRNLSVVQAEYISPHASIQELESDLGSTYPETDADFREKMVAGQPIVSHCDDPDLPVEDFEHMEAYGAKSILYLPLAFRGSAIGFAEVWESRHRREFGPDEIRVAQGIAQQAAIAIENARLYDETRRRVDHLAAMREVDQAITSSLDLSVTLNVLLDQVVKTLGVHAASVLLLKPRMHMLECVARRGFNTGALQHTRLRLGEGYAGRAALERQIIRIPDLTIQTGELSRSQMLPRERFRAYCAIPLVAKGEVKGVLEVFHRVPLEKDPDWWDFLVTLAGQAAIAIDNATLFEDLQRSNTELNLAYDRTLEGWAKALELRDKETQGHTLRVTELTLRLARKLGIPDADLVHIRRGAILHDIGKMGIPDRILHKPGPLSDSEWEIMRQHPVYAFEMLSPIGYLRPALDIPYCHHERWDGSGYPRGLAGDQIPLAARVFAAVDVWDALLSERPYRPAWPQEKVLRHIKEEAGRHFDPHIIDIFLSLEWVRGTGEPQGEITGLY